MMTIEDKIYIASRNDDTGIAYNIIFTYLISGKIDIDKFKSALDSVIKDHPGLRSTFTIENDKIIKTIIGSINSSIKFEDIRDRHIREIIKDFTKPIDLSSPPLFKTKILRESEEKHYFLLNISHIIFDGFSSGILIKDIVNYYNNSVCYKEQLFRNQLAPKINKVIPENAKTFWDTRKIKDGSIPFPFDVNSNEKHSNKGKVVHKRVDIDFFTKLKKTANICGVSTFRLIYSAYCILLSKYSDSINIISGITYSGRNRSDIMNRIGVFADVIPVLSSPKGNVSFVNFVKEINKEISESIRYFDYLNNNSIGKIKPDFVFNYYITNSVKTNNIEIKIAEETFFLPIDSVPTLFTLFFNINYSGNNIDYVYINICYNTNFFTDTFAEQIYSSYIHLLKQIVKDPTLRISKLSIIPEKPFKKIVNSWNKTSSFFDKEKSIVELFENQVKKTPENKAIIFQNQPITYKSLNQKVNNLAHFIRRVYQNQFGKELKADSLIGIYLDRSLESIISILGIMKSGAAYVPFDIQEKGENLKFKVNDSNCNIIISTQKFAKEVKEKNHRSHILLIDEKRDEIKKESNKNPNCITNGKSLAYVIYTSGSTGQPKGTLIEHASLHNLILWQIKHCSLNENKKVLHFLSTNFDASVCEIFPTLCSGSTLVTADNVEKKDIRKIINLIKTNNINVASMPPSLLSLIPKNVDIELETLRIGGEICDIEIMSHRAKKARLVNAYGPTEATVWATYNIWKDGDINTNIGKPIPNQTAYILDSSLNPVPVGVKGELFIGGIGIARGYLNRPELTKEHFIDNHFATDEDKRDEHNLKLYKTGDICRWLHNGDIEFIGRNDTQIKIRGFRVELNEIKHKLLLHKDIQQCEVIIKYVNGNKQIVAYYSAINKIEKQVLDVFLSNLLPNYMIPTFFVLIKKFPININGKVDIKSLPKPETSNYISEYIAPSTLMENIVCKLWEEILKLDKVGINDNFFELGGDSLNVLIFVSLLEEKEKLHIPVNHVYKYKSLFSLADELSKNKYIYLKKDFAEEFNTDEANTIICLKKGSGIPIYILVMPTEKPGGFSHIAEHYNGDNPIYSLYMSENLLTASKLYKIEKWYANQITKHLTQNKAILVGYCLGGLLAAQIAAKLEKMKIISKVILLDTNAMQLLNISKWHKKRILYSNRLILLYALLKKRDRRAEALKKIYDFLQRKVLNVKKPFKNINIKYYSVEETVKMYCQNELDLLKMREVVNNELIIKKEYDNSFSGELCIIKAVGKDYENMKSSKYLYWDFIFNYNSISVDSIACSHRELIKPPYVEETCRILETLCSEFQEYKSDIS